MKTRRNMLLGVASLVAVVASATLASSGPRPSPAHNVRPVLMVGQTLLLEWPGVPAGAVTWYCDGVATISPQESMLQERAFLQTNAAGLAIVTATDGAKYWRFDVVVEHD